MTDFYERQNGKRKHKCKKCEVRRVSAHVFETGYYLKKRYNITVTQYLEILENQKGCCAICQRYAAMFPKRLAVDHCHKSGKVRGLLCTDCNTSLGRFQDDPSLCRRAAEYLEKT